MKTRSKQDIFAVDHSNRSLTGIGDHEKAKNARNHLLGQVAPVLRLGHHLIIIIIYFISPEDTTIPAQTQRSELEGMPILGIIKTFVVVAASIGLGFLLYGIDLLISAGL